MVEQQEYREDGGKKKPHSKTKRNVVVVGKVYADWCGHCQMLKTEWDKMKKNMKNNKRKNIVFAEIEESEIGTKLKKLKEHHGVDVAVNGYPTLFRIENGKIDYYNGGREHGKMYNWYLKGGDSDHSSIPMPNLVEDQQGQQGGRQRHRRSFYSRRHRHHHSRHHHRRITHKNKNVERKSSGIFDFLFGK